MRTTGPSPAAPATELVETAKRFPGRLAVADLHGSITYAEFAARVGSLATRIVGAQDAAPLGSWLPVIVDRSVAGVVAIHAAIHAGRPFALIDAGLPPLAVADLYTRLGSPSHAVVARAGSAALLPSGVSVIAALDAPTVGVVDPVPVDPASAALVLFTSGSTGQPKGVVRPWSSFDHILAGLSGDPLGVIIGERPAVLRPIHFAAALHSVIAASTGASLHVLDPSAIDLRNLLDELERRRNDSIDTAGSLMAALARVAAGRRRLPELEAVSVGGDATSWELVGAIRALAAPQVRVRSRYASTEAGGIMSFDVGPLDPLGVDAVPLGRPAEHRLPRLVPLEGGSALSHLVVRDPVALGHLDDAELTARTFTSDPDGTRWWGSGDVVEVDAAGWYHHRGRADDVVKINGVLVGPRQIEDELRSIVGIGDAIVMAGTSERGRARLVAHLRLDDAGLPPAAVRRHLRERLPAALVPSVFVVHDEFPLTVTGKLDRVRLGDARPVPWGGAAERRLPVGPLEWTLVGLGAELLDLPELGPDDDLWLMGMDSLAAVEMCAAIADNGLGHLEPTDLIELATAARLARRLSGEPVERTSAVVVLNAGGTRRPVFAIPGAGATALTFRALAQALGADQPVVVVEAHGLHVRGRPDTSVRAMATRARIEIERIFGHGATDGCVVMGHSGGAFVAYEIAVQRASRGLRTRAVLIDAAPILIGAHEEPGQGGAAAPLPLKARWRRARKRLRGRALRQIPAIAARQARVMLYRIWPGRPRADVLRYSAFGWRLQRYARQYRAEPPVFPCTVLRVAGSAVGARASRLGPDVIVRLIGGTHGSCVEYPHAAEIAAVVAAEHELATRT